MMYYSLLTDLFDVLFHEERGGLCGSLVLHDVRRILPIGNWSTDK